MNGKKRVCFFAFSCPKHPLGMIALLCAILLTGCASHSSAQELPELTATPLLTAAPTSLPTPSPSPTAEPTPSPVPTPEPVTAAFLEPSSMGRKEVFPYLLPGENESVMMVRWTGPISDQTPFVLYGPDDGSGTLPANAVRAEVSRRSATTSDASYNRYFYEARLDVAPETRYIYGIEEGDAAPGVVYPFVTPRTDGAFHAVFGSDTHIENRAHGQLLASSLETALQMVLDDGHGLDGIFLLGDVVNKLDESLDVVTANAPLMRSIPSTVIVGNHDSLGAITSFFPAPHKDPTTWDYWFVRGGVLFIGMNIRYTNYLRHADFLRAAAEQAEPHNWTVMMIHYSMRTNGNHGIDRPVYNLWYFLGPVMEELDVDLVISGHDHEYDRTPLMNTSGPAPDAAGDQLVKRRGEMLFVCVPSTTGVKFYNRNIHTDIPMAAESLEAARGFVLADFSPEALRLRAVNADTGEIVDETVLRRE